MAEDVEDVTQNLPSLQFEAALSDEEKELLYLRSRSHALTVTACGQIAFLCAVLNDARKKIVDMKFPITKKSSKLLQESSQRDPLLVGIIGGGRLGKHIANTLLKFSDVQPDELYISTRRPETLTTLLAQGVNCCYDNAEVAKGVHLLILCCLPSQFATVARDIRGHIGGVVYPLIGGTPLSKITHMLEHKEILKPDFTFKQYEACTKAAKTWKVDRSVNEVLIENSSCELTCPLNQGDEAIVTTDNQWVELASYVFINMCTDFGVSSMDCLKLCNTVMFGFGPTDEIARGVILEDLLQTDIKSSDSSMLPMFSIAELYSKSSRLGERLQNPQDILHKMFVKRYKAVFDKFQYWKGIPTNM